MDDRRPREIAPAIFRDDQLNPEYLGMLLFGGDSKDDGRHYIGLAEQVQKKIAHIYTVPRPAGHRTGSIIGGGNRSNGGGADEPDALELRNFLAGWLGIRAAARATEEEMHGFVSRANGRAGRLLGRHHVRHKDRIQVRDLCICYITWLRKACDHRGAHWIEDRRARECPDCGAILVDLTALKGPTPRASSTAKER